jgi:hypothetical protein
LADSFIDNPVKLLVDVTPLFLPKYRLNHPPALSGDSSHQLMTHAGQRSGTEGRLQHVKIIHFTPTYIGSCLIQKGMRPPCRIP